MGLTESQIQVDKTPTDYAKDVQSNSINHQNQALNIGVAADVLTNTGPPPGTTLYTNKIGTFNQSGPSPTIYTLMDAKLVGVPIDNNTSPLSQQQQDAVVQTYVDNYKKNTPNYVAPVKVITNPLSEFSSFGSTNRTESSTTSLEQVITSADLSVFYVAEIPLAADIIDPTVEPGSWRKEVVVLEMDAAMSISYSTIRERYPVRAMGHANPLSHTKGGRTIAGHIAFAIFVDDVLGRLRTQLDSNLDKYQQALSSANAQVTKDQTNLNRPLAPKKTQYKYNTNALLDGTLPAGINYPSDSYKTFDPDNIGDMATWNSLTVNSPKGRSHFEKIELDAKKQDAVNAYNYQNSIKAFDTNLKAAQQRGEYYRDLTNQFNTQKAIYINAFQGAQLLDSLPPFNLLVMGTNESGQFTKFLLKNVVIIDENQHQGVQQPNIINKVQFVAQDIVPMGKFSFSPNEPTRSLGSIQENYCNGSFRVTGQMNEMSGSSIIQTVEKSLNDVPMFNSDQPWKTPNPKRKLTGKQYVY